MSNSAVRGGFFFVLLLFLVSCMSFPTVKPRIYQDFQLPTAVDRARREFQEGRLTTALVLLANHQESSEEKQILIDQIVRKLKNELNQVQDQQQRSDFSRVLALFSATEALEPAYEWPSLLKKNQLTTSSEEWIKGMVTIIVDRGMKIENGRGYFDIGAGSGFFISSEGYLLTNHHVIEQSVDPEYKGYVKLTVRLPHSRGEKLPVKVVGWDRNYDLALLKVEYEPEFIFTFSQKAEDVRPGKKVFALGSPGGLDATITQGIISSRKKIPEPGAAILGEVIQIDVPVNPGNSGGPLVNEKGEVIGVVFSKMKGFEGVNFAIPGSVAFKLLPRLKNSERLNLAWLGMGLIEDLHGLEVSYVLPESPADLAGVRVGDRLQTFERLVVKEIAAIQEKLLDWGPSGIVRLGIERENQDIALLCGLASRPDNPIQKAFESDLRGNLIPLLFGIRVNDIGQFVDKGFRVVKVYSGSIGDDLGLVPNDPFSILRIFLAKERKTLVIDVYFKRRQGGNLESGITLMIPLIGQQMI